MKPAQTGPHTHRAGVPHRFVTFLVTTLFVVLSAASPRPATAALVAPLVPELEPGAGIIKDKQAAIALGKALFWDELAGSDGMACASCHFSAGADSRIRNQLSPGFNDAAFSASGGDKKFGSTHSDTGAVAPGNMPSGAKADSNYLLKAADFPLHQLSDYRNRNSPLITTTNDVVSSSGAYAAEFTKVNRLGTPDQCGKADGSIFHAGKFPARQVEPRNTPTTINAAFYHANFWDGRANNLFNGVGVFGLRDIDGDPNKRLVVRDSSGVPQAAWLEIRNASLASQAVGPPLSALEMSCSGRTFPDLGRKLLLQVPLRNQTVSRTDSVLGPLANTAGNGLKSQYTYAKLIMQAFEPRFWSAAGVFKMVDGQLIKGVGPGYSQMEMNFSMFWGIAVMMYEQTLVSDQSKFDTWFADCKPVAANPVPATVPDPNNPGGPAIPNPVTPNAGTAPVSNPVVTCADGQPPERLGFTSQEVLGFGLFSNAGTGPRNAGNPACAGCHGPIANPRAAAGVILPVLSEAAFTSGQTGPFNPVERSLITDLGDGIPLIPLPTTDQRAGAVHDRGFFNIGVTPSSVDPGNGGLDAYANPLSASRMFLEEQAGGVPVDPALLVTPATATTATLTAAINRCTATAILEPGGTPPFPGCGAAAGLTFDANLEREAVDGTFKTPSLRNVGMTAPYFHSGNYADLRSVVEFYARGGSRRSKSLDNLAFTGDTSGTGPLGKGPHVLSGPEFGTNVDFFMRDIKSTNEQIDALVAFMLTLSDPRVQCDAAPFDHPMLRIRNGHTTNDVSPKDGRADDVQVTLPAVGAAGYSKTSGYCVPNRGNFFAKGAQGRVGGVKPVSGDL